MHRFHSQSLSVCCLLGWLLILMQYCPSVSTLSAFSSLASASARLAAFRGCTMTTRRPHGHGPTPTSLLLYNGAPGLMRCYVIPSRLQTLCMPSSMMWLRLCGQKKATYTQDMCLFLSEGIARVSRAEVGGVVSFLP